MSKTTFNRSNLLLPIQMLLVLGFLCLLNYAKADDTEVFYGEGVKNNNVLFIMDNSRSMAKKVPDTVVDGGLSFEYGTAYGAEESTSTEITKTDSSDLELGNSRSVGLRFTQNEIPKNATIESAYIQFTSDSDTWDISTVTSTLNIQIESADSASAFTHNDTKDIADRTLYSMNVPWNPEAWDTVNEQGVKQKTPDLKSLVQEVVNRDGWEDRNSIVFVITGSGKRSAQSRETNDGKDAPILLIQYVTEGEKTRMQVMQDALGTVLQNPPDNLSVGIMNYGDTMGERVDFPNGVKFPVTSVNSLARPIVEAAMTISGTPRWDLSNIPEPTEDIIVSAFLSEIVDDWKPAGYTPIVDSIFEAAKYFRAEEVNFGFGLAKKELKYPAHPSTYEGAPVTNAIDVGSCSAEPRIVKVWGNNEMDGWNDGTDTDGNICPSDRESPSGPGTAENCVLTKHDCDLEKQECLSGWVSGSEGECTGEPDEAGNPTECEEIPGYCPDDDGDGNPDWDVVGSDGYCHYAVCEDGPLSKPKYLTPIEDGCQTNFMILMSDGSPKSSSDTKPESYEDIKTMMGVTACDANESGVEVAPFGFEAGYCGKQLTHYLAENDNSTVEGDQFINTYVIGFSAGISVEAEGYLKSLVTIEDDETTENREGYFSATSEEELANAFAKTLETIAAETRSQASPGYSVNVKSGLEHEDDIYIPVFDKNSSSIWSGNLKKFRLVDEDGHRYIRGKTIVTSDSNATGYIDAMTELGLFKATAWDEWSTSDAPDGDEVEKGGAAGLLNDPDARNLYSNLTGDSNVTLSLPANHIKTDNLDSDDLNEIADEVLYDADALGLVTDEEKTAHSEKLIEFIRGWKSGLRDDLEPHGEPRLHMGDMLHSEPVVITYEKSTDETAKKQYIFAATNEGYLHAFDSTTGVEKFAFMPKELLKNIQTQFTGTGTHLYGIDGNISFWHEDIDKDGQVDADVDHVYLYFGMRRGGHSYYALDVTDIESPKLKWVINNEDSGFERLGQSWSLPYLAKVITSSGDHKEAVIFTGGNHPVYDYDVDYEVNDVKEVPTTGVVDPDTNTVINGDDIYIVDAKTGYKLWSMRDTLGSTVTHAIPGGARILDVNQNGILDRMYFGDTGGNVWRLDFLAEKLTSSSDDFKLTKFAELGKDGSDDARKFYNEPDVSSMRVGGKTVFAISIGSGLRPHPMNEVIKDHMFVLLDTTPLSKIADADDGDYPIKIDKLAKVEIDAYTDETGVVTKSIDKKDGFEGKKITQIDKRGWYVQFADVGEKVLATAITFEGSLIFTTLVPESLTQGELIGSCAAPATQGRIYALDILTAEASVNLDRNKDGEGKDIINDNDAFLTISAGEIPGTPQRVFNELKCEDGECTHEVDVRVGKKGSEAGIKDVSDIESIYWSDPSN